MNQLINDNIIFIDPGSKSCGWAVFSKRGKFITSGTIKSTGTIGKRLKYIVGNLHLIIVEHNPEVVIIERMNYKAHYYLQWMVGALVYVCFSVSLESKIDFMSPGTWKKKLPIDMNLAQYTAHQEILGSEDEAVAILMGKAWFTK